MATTIEIAGQVFDGGAPAIANGMGWTWRELRGWGDGTAVELSSAKRGGGDGLAFTDARYGGMELTLLGTVICTSRAASWAARERLPALFDAVRGGRVLKVNEPTPKQALVRRDGALRIGLIGGIDVAFEVPLLSHDWRRFSTVETSEALTIVAAGTSKTRTLTNAGTVETHPVVTITGPANNPRLANLTTGEELELTGVLAAGDTLVVDFYDQTVKLNGAPADYVASGDAWWTLGPGAHSIRYRVTTSSAADSTATFRFRSAWA